MADQRGRFSRRANRIPSGHTLRCEPAALEDRRRSGLAGHAASTQLPTRQVARLDRASRTLLLAAHEAWHRRAGNPRRTCRWCWAQPRAACSWAKTTSSVRLALLVAIAASPRARCTISRRRRGARGGGAGFCGPILIIANACASGSNALGQAWEIIRSGRTDRALAGGYDALTQLVFGGFDSLQAISPTGCRPFDAARWAVHRRRRGHAGA